MKAKRIVAIVLVVVLIMSACLMLSGCFGSGEEQKIYKCGYCGRIMKGAYYDYINGRYACRSCSKQLRH